MACQIADQNGSTQVGTEVCVYLADSSGNGTIKSYNENGNYTIQMLGPPIYTIEGSYKYIFLGTCSTCNLTCKPTDYSIPVLGCINKTLTLLAGAAVIVGGYFIIKKR
jgi:hypothetical protein